MLNAIHSLEGQFYGKSKQLLCHRERFASLIENLSEKTFTGLQWSFIERTSQQIVQFIISIILARLLLPAEFGLIAMLALFIAFAQIFLDSGFAHALVNKQDATRLDESSIFYFNIFLGIVIVGLMYFAAPWIAAFYEIPVLTPLTRVLSLNLIIYSFGHIQTSLMTKRINFRTQMKISLTSVLVSGTIGITMAVMDYGVWSLVGQTLTYGFAYTILAWTFNSWRPIRAFSLKSLRSMFKFGSNILLTGLLNAFFDNIFLLIIGKYFTPSELGFYSRAKGTQSLPTNNLTGSVARVTFPIFSLIQDDKARLKRGVKKVVSTIAFINSPIMIGLAVTANPFVLVILTEKWLPSVPYLQLLCIVGLLYPFNMINLNTLKAQGYSDLYFRIELLNKVLIALAIVVTYRWGIEAMIYGQIVTAIIAYILTGIHVQKLLNYSLWEQMMDIAPSLIIALIMGGIIYSIGLTGIHNPLMLLILQVVAGIGVFGGLCHLFKLPPFNDLIDIIQSKFSKIICRQVK